ncbi:oxygen-dependent tRNA uridine(34) hydroxylase TrhO [Geofilum sp. OHC36d9]|uniref:oxygen-dependent tRNA uridine(34) hydroxylase TrhO n=1 Tax=Geofilum sp. OHC36d9 TaxID=3458413 RepID=UPI004033D863
MSLYNKLNTEQLIEKLKSETFKRRTLSFYRYVQIDEPNIFRDELYKGLDELQCNGRIYVAKEGINAQMNVPEPHINALLNYLESIPQLRGMQIKWAIEESMPSFIKLIVRVRPKIVADGLNDNMVDLNNVGNRLSPIEFHELSDKQDVIVVDMRNNYESEVGRFVNAYCPDASTFREEVELVVNELEDKKDKKILLYCTGGVRCEKASAWLKQRGFKDVNQLHGGVIAYVAEIKQKGLSSRFIGKNFVFDERLGERVTPHILGKCHNCGKPCDIHINCAYDPCHDLVIQCNECSQKYNDCCSVACHENLKAHPDQKSREINKRQLLNSCST